MTRSAAAARRPAPPQMMNHVIPGRYPVTVEWIYIRDTFADPAYQRGLIESKVRKLVEEFDLDALSFPHVSERRTASGKIQYAIMDGQNRIEAVRRVLGEDQMMECAVYRGLTLAREAQIFKKLNDGKKVRELDKFLSQITGGDEETIAIARIVQSIGLTVQRARGDKVVQAVDALRKVYRGDRRYGIGRHELPLKRTLVVLNDAWGPAADAFQSPLIQGVGMLMTRCGDQVDVERLVRKLQAYPHGALGFLGSAKGIKSVMGGDYPHAVATLTVNVYNRGNRGKSNLPAWREEK